MISCFSIRHGIETFRVDPSLQRTIYSGMHTTLRVKALLMLDSRPVSLSGCSDVTPATNNIRRVYRPYLFVLIAICRVAALTKFNLKPAVKTLRNGAIIPQRFQECLTLET